MNEWMNKWHELNIETAIWLVRFWQTFAKNAFFYRIASTETLHVQWKKVKSSCNIVIFKFRVVQYTECSKSAGTVE
jgi:hypothetical protein